MPDSQERLDRKELVRSGFDRASYEYRGPAQSAPMPDYDALLDDFVPRLPRPACVLDLGCGCGVPVAQRLARTFDVTGLDISQVQIQRARALVPGAKFILADMAGVDFPEGCFEGIVALFSIIHLPVDQHEALLHRMRKWLQPRGWLLITVGREEWSGLEENWLSVRGATMYWSHAGEETYRRWLQEAGFDVLGSRRIAGDPAGYPQVLARAAT